MKNLTFYNDTEDAQSFVSMADAMDRAADASARFRQQLLTLGAEGAAIGIVAASFRVLENVMADVLKNNAQYRAELGRLKGALTDAFLPVLDWILPGLLALMRILTAVFSLIGSLFGLMGGGKSRSLDKQAKSIRGVGKAAREAQKDLAGFDEINRLSDRNTGGGSGGSGGGFGGDGLDFTDYKAKIDELTVYLSGALLALGAILTFSGANIPLGLGLMAMGAIGLASVVKENWGAMDDGLRRALTNVALILGGGALAIGAVLAFSGANLPLGIGLMLAGAAGLGSAAALNWNAIVDKLKEVWGNIRLWWNGSVAPKLTLNYWQDKFKNIAEGLKIKIRDGVNGGIALMNRFIGWINSALHLSWGGLSAFGQTVIPPGSYQLLTIPNIPMLARGAVIPPNAPFLAMLGDQKNGTNLEAPEALLRQIVREENGTGDVSRLLELLIETVRGIRIGDAVIGRAADRYQTARTRARGL